MKSSGIFLVFRFVRLWLTGLWCFAIISETTIFVVVTYWIKIVTFPLSPLEKGIRVRGFDSVVGCHCIITANVSEKLEVPC